MPRAMSVIDAIAGFVESKNTRGSGARYARKFKAAINKLAIPNVHYSLCNHPVLAAYQYSCSNFNDWVIAFRKNGGGLIVYEIFHSSILF